MVLGADGILRVFLDFTGEETEALAVEALTIVRQLTAGRPVPLLVDLRGGGTHSRAARKAYASATDLFSAQALLFGSPLTEMIAGLFLRLFSDEIPTRVFRDEDEAVAFLSTFVLPRQEDAP